MVFFSSLLSAKDRLTLTLSKSLYLLLQWWWSSFNLPFFPFCNLTTIIGDGPQSIKEGWQKGLTAVNLPKMQLIYTFFAIFCIFCNIFCIFCIFIAFFAFFSHLLIFIAFTDFYRIFRSAYKFTVFTFFAAFLRKFFAVSRKFFLRFTVIYGRP